MIDVTKEERVVTLQLDAPPVNVLDAALLRGLTEQLRRCAADDELAAVLLRGKDRCFSAGASVEEHEADKAPAMLGALLEACTALAELPVPIAALVHGPCLGGALELVSFCDFVVADPSATFGVPEITLAFFPPLACVRLPRLAGLQNAAYLALTGEAVDAERAAAMGLVQELSAPVLRLAKEALTTASGGIRWEALEGMNSLFLSKLYQIEDVAEGIASFAERRKPEFKHK
jgi:cyclohexa-1,5-dienecarbonyl-CoA hydratase